MKYALGMPPDAAKHQFEDLVRKVSRPYVAFEVWGQLFDTEQRRQLGDDFESAYCNPNRTAGMWAKVHGVSAKHAVIELALELQMIHAYESQWLIRELEIDVDGCSAVMEAAVASGHLVLCENPKRLFWRGEEVAFTGGKTPWQYIWELAAHCKRNLILDRTVFGEDLKHTYLTQLKSRVINDCGLPPEFGEIIVNCNSYCQRLDLPSSRQPTAGRAGVFIQPTPAHYSTGLRTVTCTSSSFKSPPRTRNTTPGLAT